MNSASDAGGFPEAEHFRVEPHEPVSQVPVPVLSKLQPVRPHIRPDQPTGALNTMDWPGLSSKPPPLKLSPGVIAGQTTWLHEFTIVNTRAESDHFVPDKSVRKSNKILGDK